MLYLSELNSVTIIRLTLTSKFAREEGIEPTLTVLETVFLPLKDPRIKTYSGEDAI